MHNNKSICVIGLGKLGLCLVVVLAESNHNVIGLDANEYLISSLSEGKCNSIEPLLANKVRDVVLDKKRLTVTQNYADAISKSDIVFIVVPTNSLDNGRYDTSIVKTVAEKIALELRETNSFKVITLVSTVLPGNTRKELIDVLENISGKKCGIDFGVCYNPEFIALGKVIKDMHFPDMILIGASDDKSGNILKELYKSFVLSNPKIFISNIESVELAKISVNVFVTMKMAFGITLAEMCEKIPGCDIDNIVNMIGADSRIGRKYLDIGTSYGGPCFPRDNRAFSVVASDARVVALLAKDTDNVNHLHNMYIYKKIQNILKDDEKIVSILGMTYKPDTNIVDESASLEIIRMLLGNGYRVKIYEPSGYEETKKVFGELVEYCNSISSCLLNSNLAVIAVKYKEFQTLSPRVFLSNMETPNILDCWRIYDSSLFEQGGVNYYCIGRYGY